VSTAPICHPQLPYYARWLCRDCYEPHRHSGTHVEFPRRNHSSTELAARAERLRAELEAAAAYLDEPVTWHLIARKLGVKYKTLDRARCRAKRYAARERVSA
jgi:hypothetical protein